MFNLILVIFSFQSIFSLNSEDLCSSLTCKGKHRYQCSIDLCGLNAKTCDNYYKFKRFHLSHSLYAFRKFKKNLNACESNELSNKNDYCLNNSKCFKKQFVLAKGGFKSIETIINCNCEGNYSYKCGDYCTISNNHCKKIIQYEHKFNRYDLQNCTLI